MNTITSAPFVPLLEQLFADSERTKREFKERMGNLSPEDRAALMANTDPLELYARAKDVHLAVSRETANLLYILARSSGARAIVEFGASFGVSTLHLAAALRDLGGGRLISSEFEPSKVAHARENLSCAGLLDLVDLRVGDALHTFARDLPSQIDLLFLDGAKPLYLPVLSLTEPYLRAGALVIADNADGSPDYLRHIHNSRKYLSTRFNDLELAIKLGETT
ncbi:putative O-methyltransferase YrrM [Rhodanobacter sp. K2T2]|uniref:O-methyltransferase n=1 Tax=Rhodanobacter sp. K2T2 TaxID=2723085 RepID=UPI0015CD4C18|nr:class I SAM-dependent methyltransferase [Rhodanobacter sp. K2T2]NYE30923.1 putative O-methyltransferase YrrM [Rhodanobacter sp. K2T2]